MHNATFQLGRGHVAGRGGTKAPHRLVLFSDTEALYYALPIERGTFLTGTELADPPLQNREARMEIQRIIAELREERARLDEAISALEKVALTQKPRRGRPPALTKGNSLDAPERAKAPSNSKDGPSHLTATTH
jgi:hypothetical protein